MAVYGMQTDWNVRPENCPEDNSAALQVMIDSYEKYSVVKVPPGVYKVKGTAKVEKQEDWAAQLVIESHGRRTTIFKQEEVGDPPIFKFETTAGNCRDLVLKDLCFLGGGLELNKCVYNYFCNINFGHTWDSPCLQIGANSGINIFDNCWWVHCNQVVQAPSASSNFSNCIIGEDAGHIRIKHSLWTGCQFHDAGHKPG